MSEASDDYRDLNDQSLLRDCRWEAFRGPGPGGQKRNKTSSSVRLTHVPTGLHVIAGESRSQVENKARALWRLKLRLALSLRRAIDPRGWEPPAWVDQIRTRPAKNAQAKNAPVKNVAAGSGMRLQISHRHPLYFHLVGLTLDLLEARSGNVADVAGLLGLSTSSVIKFLTADPHVWTTANQIRAKSGQPALNVRK